MFPSWVRGKRKASMRQRVACFAQCRTFPTFDSWLSWYIWMDSPMLHTECHCMQYACMPSTVCLGNTACFDLERQSTSAMCAGDCMIQTSTLSPSWSLKQPWFNWTRQIIFASSPASQIKRKANLRKSVQLDTCKTQILAICSSELTRFEADHADCHPSTC